MKQRKKFLILLLTSTICFIILYIYGSRIPTLDIRLRNELIGNIKTPVPTINHHHHQQQQEEIVIAVVACNQRTPETLNMIKSALIFNQNEFILRFIVITEDDLMTAFREKLEDWQLITKPTFKFEILPLTFPETNRNEWKNLFKPCAAQRLFLPSMLKNIDSVLYMDTDTLFLSPVDEIWKFFSQFNATQIAGLSPEHEDSNVGWYNRFARHPFYGPLGVNSGVMLMNLTRMREFRFEENILPIYKEYRLKITWGDQDLINILFYFHSDKLFVFNCEWNYRPDHCMYMSVCKALNGIKILHGNRGYFHADKQPAFSAIYSTFEEFRLGEETNHQLLVAMDTVLTDETVISSNCGKVKEKMLYKARQLFTDDANYSYPI